MWSPILGGSLKQSQQVSHLLGLDLRLTTQLDRVYAVPAMHVTSGTAEQDWLVSA